MNFRARYTESNWETEWKPRSVRGDAELVPAGATSEGNPIGSGLSLAKILIDCMGGRLSQISRPGLGSVVSIQLPTSGSSVVRSDGSMARYHDLDVLIISSRSTVRRILRTQFAEWGAHLTIAMSIEEACELAKESRADDEPFSLVIVDQDETTTSGPELSNAMSDPDRLAGLPVIVLGDPTKSETVAGADGVLRRPITLKALEDMLLSI